MASSPNDQNPSDTLPGHSPNLTTSDASQPSYPRDPNQPIHRKPRVFIHRPNEDPEEEVTARQNASVLEAAKMIELSDFRNFHKMPCVRDAGIPGIASGVGIGLLRFVVGGSIFAAYNWSVGSFLGVSVVMYNYCQRQRAKEKDNIRRAVKVLDEKQKQKDQQVAATKTNPQEVLQQADPRQNADFWSSFKFW